METPRKRSYKLFQLNQIIHKGYIRLFFLSLLTIFSSNALSQSIYPKSGVYNIQQEFAMDDNALAIKGDTLYIMHDMRLVYLDHFYHGHFYSGPIVKSNLNIIGICKLIPLGCNIFEFSTNKSPDIFADMIVTQIDSGQRIESDSTTVDIILTDYKDSWPRFTIRLLPDNSLIPTVEDGIFRFILPPSVNTFTFVLLPSDGTFWYRDLYYNELGVNKYRFNQLIPIKSNNIKIYIPGNLNSIFKMPDFDGQLIREIHPGVLKWQNKLYFYDKQETKKYLDRIKPLSDD